MKKRKFSKVIAVALAALMVVGMVPMMAFAGGQDFTNGVVQDAEYYSSSYTYENGDESAYINFEYTGVDASTQTATFANGEPIEIKMSDGEGYSTKDATDQLGWYSDIHSINLGGSNNRSDNHGSDIGQGYNALSVGSDHQSGWSAVAVAEDGTEYTFDISGINTANEQSVTDTTGKSMATTLSFDDGLEPGKYTLDVTYEIEIKHNHAYTFIVSIDSWKNQLTVYGEDTIYIEVTDEEYVEPEKETVGTYTKTIDGNNVTITGSDDDAISFTAHLSAYGTAIGNEVNEDDIQVPGITAYDEFKASFEYEGIDDIENGTLTVKDTDESFSIKVTDSDYYVKVSLTETEIAAVLDAMGYGDYSSYVSRLGLDFPIEVEAETWELTPTFTAYAVAEDGTEYPFEVTEEDGVYTFTATDDIPAGDYGVVVDYNLDFSFTYSYTISVYFNLLITIDLEIGVEGSVPSTRGDNERYIKESDTLALTVECDHDWNKGVVTTQPTCTEAGEKIYTCSKCGETYTEIIDATGHEWDEGQVTKEATCTDAGETTYTCTVCEATTTAESPALGHAYSAEEGYVSFDWADDNADVEHLDDVTCTAVFTCTECGAEAEVTCSVEEDKKQHADASCTEPEDVDLIATATIESRDGEIVTATSEDHIQGIILGHAYDDGVVIKAATCGEDGEMLYTCTRENCAEDAEGHTKTEVIPATGDHTYGIDEEESYDATCTEDGQTVYVCEVCGDTYTETIEATGSHTWGDPEFEWSESGFITKTVSCKATITCEICGETETVDCAVTSATTKEATCTEDGETTYTATAEFTNIEGEYTDSSYTKAISASGHTLDYDNDTVYNWAEDYSSCTAVTTCSVCGETEENECTVSSAITTPATCVKDGEMTYTATFHVGGLDLGDLGVVGGTDYFGYETEAIPATGHTAGTPVMENQTSTSYDEVIYCTVCGEELSRETIQVEAEQKIPQTSTETIGEITKTVYGQDVSFTGGGNDTSVDVAVSVLGEDYPVGEIFVDDSVSASFKYDGVYVDGTFTADSGTDVTFGVSDFTYSYEPTIVITEELITGVLDQLGLGSFVSMLPALGLDLPIVIDTASGYVTDTMANVTYVVTAVAEDGTVYEFDVVYDGNNATFTCAGLPDGDYEVTVAYDIDLGFVYDYMVSVMGIEISAADTAESVRVISSSDSFTLSVYEGGVMGDTGTSEGPSREIIPQESEEELEGGIIKTVYGNDVEFAGGSSDDVVVDVAVSVLGEDYPVGEIAVEDKLDITFDYTGTYADGTIEVASGEDVVFGVSDFTFSYEPTIVITEELITGVLDQLGLGSFVSMLPMLGLDLPIVIDTESGYITDTMANVTYVVTAVAEDGTVYEFDVAYDGNNATFTCSGMPDGDYEITVAYEIDLGFVYDYMVSVMGIEIAAADTVEVARIVASSDTFKLSIYEGASMEDQGSTGGSTGEEPGEEEPGEEEPGEEEPGEEEPGEETEHEHDFYIVDSAEATCEDEGWVLYACSECGLTYTQYTAALGHDFVDGVCTRCGALEEEVGTTAGSGSSSKAALTTSEDEDEDEFEEVEDEDEFTEVEEDEFEIVEDEDLTSPATGASMAAIGAAMAFAAAGIVVVTRKKKEDEE